MGVQDQAFVRDALMLSVSFSSQFNSNAILPYSSTLQCSSLKELCLKMPNTDRLQQYNFSNHPVFGSRSTSSQLAFQSPVASPKCLLIQETQTLPFCADWESIDFVIVEFTRLQMKQSYVRMVPPCHCRIHLYYNLMFHAFRFLFHI